MKLTTIMTVNAFIWIALGIIFMLYAPVMLAFFNLPNIPAGNTQGTTLMYWNVAAFARLYGAALFTLGFLLWAVRGLLEAAAAPPESHRGIAFALLLGNGLAFIVALTQQSSVWLVPAGWVLVLIYLVITAAYGYALAAKK
jgi:hypothetical protein